MGSFNRVKLLGLAKLMYKFNVIPIRRVTYGYKISGFKFQCSYLLHDLGQVISPFWTSVLLSDRENVFFLPLDSCE